MLFGARHPCSLDNWPRSIDSTDGHLRPTHVGSSHTLCTCLTPLTLWATLMTPLTLWAPFMTAGHAQTSQIGRPLASSASRGHDMTQVRLPLEDMKKHSPRLPLFVTFEPPPTLWALTRNLSHTLGTDQEPI